MTSTTTNKTFSYNQPNLIFQPIINFIEIPALYQEIKDPIIIGPVYWKFKKWENLDNFKKLILIARAATHILKNNFLILVSFLRKIRAKQQREEGEDMSGLKLEVNHILIQINWLGSTCPEPTNLSFSCKQTTEERV